MRVGNAGECEKVSKLSVYAHQAGVQRKTVIGDHGECQGAGQEPAGTFLSSHRIASLLSFMSFVSLRDPLYLFFFF